jgi:hypothetical protein
MLKKSLSVLLALVIILTLAAVPAFASSNDDNIKHAKPDEEVDLGHKKTKSRTRQKLIKINKARPARRKMVAVAAVVAQVAEAQAAEAQAADQVKAKPTPLMIGYTWGKLEQWWKSRHGQIEKHCITSGQW